MSKLVILNLGAGNLKDGFTHIIAQLRLKNATFEQTTGSLPPNPELAELYQRWQLLYQALQQRFDVSRRRLFEVDSEGLTNVSAISFYELSQDIKTKFNLWLSSPTFLPINNKLRTKLTPDEEIQIVIETNELLLHGFPWHLWHLLDDYPYAEIGMSISEYSIVTTDKSRDKLRVLAILGHSDGINVEADRELITQIDNADITFLVEPKLAQFHQILWDEQGWDLLFFAGHSHTENYRGVIFLNPHETLTISELKTALRKAIENGLNLAIFNSCDGIGLAQELSMLNIPQVIVMREGVPDFIAQEFLKYFLCALQQQKSVFCSLREARERLEAWDKDFPGGSWLPIIYQNLSAFNVEIKIQNSLQVFPDLSINFWNNNNSIDLENTIFYKRIKETDLLVKIVDITSLDVDIIVSSDDNYLRMGGGISASILKKGGNMIREQAKKIAPINLGDVAITGGGNLLAKYIFHGAVLDYELFYREKVQKPNMTVIQQVTQKCLKLAETVNAKSIAFPALATGTGGIAPEHSALGIMIETLKVLKSSTSLETIIIALYGRKNQGSNEIKGLKSRFLNQISHFLDTYQQIETRSELLTDLTNIFQTCKITSGLNIFQQYQQQLHQLLDEYINTINQNYQ